MHGVLRDNLNIIAFVYLDDDLIFFSKFLEEHQLHFKSFPAMSPGKPSICEIW